MTQEKPASHKGKQPLPIQERPLGLSYPSTPEILFKDSDLIDAVFSGGYYIVLISDEYPHSATARNTRSQQKRNQKKEEALQLANLTGRMIASLRDNPATDIENTDIKEKDHSRRHDMLLEDLQTLINKSDLVLNDHSQHLKHELDVARQQLLRGGGIDDFSLMQTLQEIAEVQGLSTAGGSMAGKFASDIIDPPEPEKQPEAVIKEAQHAKDNEQSSFFPLAFGANLEAGSLDNDVEEFVQRNSDRFSAYDIAEIGGCRHKHSHFFAKSIIASLLSLDKAAEPGQNSLEVSP